jgi:alkylhydroperoxidase family enzyme
MRKLGETDNRIFAVVAWREAPFFTDAERAALALTEAVTRLDDRADPVPDEIWDKASRHYDEDALAPPAEWVIWSAQRAGQRAQTARICRVTRSWSPTVGPVRTVARTR